MRQELVAVRACGVARNAAVDEAVVEARFGEWVVVRRVVDAGGVGQDEGRGT